MMRNGILRKILLITAGSVFLFSGIMVSRYHLEMRAYAQNNEALIQSVITTIQPTSAPAQSPIPSTATPEPTRSAPVSTLIETEAPATVSLQEVPQLMPESQSESIPTRVAPIQVDFAALQSENQDVVAWVYCPDTPINYPVLQASDNDHYLHRFLDGSRKYAGSLFMDYRNVADLSDWNSIIYGHNMKNGAMFGTLQKYKNQAYFDEHPELFLLTPNGDYAIKLISGFVAKDDDPLYNAMNPSADQKADLLQKWQSSSNFISENHPSAQNRLITLSTCSYEFNNARYILIGILEALASPEI